MATSSAAAQSGCPVCLAPLGSRSPHLGRSVVVCSARDCGLQYLDPHPTASELTALYAATYYRPETPNAQNTYVSTPDEMARGLLQALTTERGSVAGSRLLDFGAGVGTFARVAQQAGADVT